ncbi:MAG TPA: CusA/CzcA family heavy metal efflux RND transporter [Gemmatimonadales bacterium]|nr:CusA/CzcA family heavy metal efflux RND transporter [Gemmatimonadales bacterium]
MTAPIIPPPDGHTTDSGIHRLVRVALEHPWVVLSLAVLLSAVGVWSFSRLPVDAYPDIAPPIVSLGTQWPGQAAEEVERLITVPLETAMNGLPGIQVIRSVSLYGLSSIDLTFRDGTDNYFARQQVFERLRDVELPDGVEADVEPLSAVSGLVYRYVLESPDRTSMELKTLQDWVLPKAYKAVPGVADLSGIGGQTMQYQVVIDPIRLAGAGLSVPMVAEALANNNGNAGGGFYSEGGQFYYVRGLGRLERPEDIGNVVLAVQDGTPVLVRDVARVEIGHAPRLGQFGFNGEDDAVEGIVLMRVGEQAATVLQGIQAKTRELNSSILPPDVKVHAFYDRSDLIEQTTRTVEANLVRGIVLVVVVLIFFLFDLRAGLIVAATIPLSLLFAFIWLDIRSIPANLLSIGAIDFGILVDGAVVMVENIHRSLARRQGTSYAIREVITEAAREVNRPIVYAVAIIVAGFLPIYALSGPSGRLFRPMADTMIFALIGALILALTVLPVLAMLLLRRGVTVRRNRPFEWIRTHYASWLDRSLRIPRTIIAGSVAIFAGALLLTGGIGAEFMPHLDEGALWVRATMPSTISLDASSRIVPEIREVIRSFPEVTDVGSEHGRPDDGTDATGFFNAEFFVGLKPYDSWTGSRHTKADLIADINTALQRFPGVEFNYTQPAEDNVNEVETGLKSSLAVKIFGEDLVVLEQKGHDVAEILGKVPGVDRVSLVHELGQPALTVQLDRSALARYGLNVADVNAVIESAIGGLTATQVVQGEKLFDLVVRLEPQFRETPDQIAAIPVATPAGGQVPLRELGTIAPSDGASFIYREDNARYIGIQFAVEGRDLAGAVQDAQRAVAAGVHLPTGYHMAWGGEYEQYTASRAQLQVILPLTVALILILLFALYRNLTFPLITVIGVVLSAPVGGVVALWLTGTPFSVSSGIGFLALFGVSVQTAVVYISRANELRRAGQGIAEATREAALDRLRPIMMTALVAAFGLLPAALSVGVGADSQKPFALVIVGGLFSRLLISVFLMPVLYVVSAREGDRLEV